ncbi:MAG: ZIP family metal transporter [Chloroflexi bacterium]|nr:ZIP family metal transporter [Chloroflexota bacterium]
MMSVWIVALAALITAVATGIGAVPFFFVREMPRRWLGLSNALAAGLMLGASISLIREGIAFNLVRTLVGAAVGVVLIIAARAALGEREELAVGRLEGADALEALMIVGIMTVHSFAEGVGVGVSYGGGGDLGNLITAAIAIHNIPEGLAISLVLVPRGVPAWRAGLWSIVSSLPQPIMAIPAFLFVTLFEPLLPAGLGFAAGAMIYMVATELVPEARKDATDLTVAGVTLVAAVAMIIFEAVL